MANEGSNVLTFTGAKQRATPEEAIKIASQQRWMKALVIGYTEEGHFHFVASEMSIEAANFLCDQMKRHALDEVG